MHRSSDLPALLQPAYETLRMVAAAPLAENRASLDWGFPEGVHDPPGVIELIPRVSGAAPLIVAVDRPGEAYIDVGPHGTHFELWERPGPPFELALREIAESVVFGRYEEWVRLDAGGRLIAAKGVLGREEGRPRTVVHNTLGLWTRRRPGWRHVRYVPYG